MQLRVTRTELDEVLKTSRRGAAENEKLRTRIHAAETASQNSALALERAQADLAFCGNIEKRQLWSSLSESKRRIITLQVETCRPLLLVMCFVRNGASSSVSATSTLRQLFLSACAAFMSPFLTYILS